MQKKPLILIICGAIAILAVILLIVYIARGGSTDIKDITSKKEDETKVAVPEIILSSYPEEETEGSVEISIDAKIEGEDIHLEKLLKLMIMENMFLQLQLVMVNQLQSL